MQIQNLLLTAVIIGCLTSLGNAQEIKFNDQIRPILSEHCFSCHGPDSGSRKADLRLDQRESAIDAGAISPGKVDDSEIIARIMSDDPDSVMPPPSFRKPLSKAQKQMLAGWIKGGAEWEEHWAFIKPVRPPLPVSDNELWVKNAIDAFIALKLDKLGVKPNAEADRYRLARRASLDITGLPPSVEMVENFVNDNSFNAYEKYIDSLLDSQHSGEHRARYWLDAARYGDTHGMHVDNYREVWPYRDWVVNAFNSNMPFDQFVIEQIGGDMLPNATIDQRIATGFNRCNITTAEGGAIPAELDVRYMVDRVETTATVFLGLTAGCAVCHDHKYDPISQKEFYQLGAFFNNTTQHPMDGNQKDAPPALALPSKDDQKEWDAIHTKRDQLRQRIAKLTKSTKRADIEAWWKHRERTALHVISEDDLLLYRPLTEGEDEITELPKGARWETEHAAGKRGIRFEQAAKLDAKLPKLKSGEPLTISFWFRTPDKLTSLQIMSQSAQTKDKKTLGWKVDSSTQGALTFEMHDGKGAKIRALLPGDQALTPRSWQHVCVRYSGGQSNSSVTILSNAHNGRLRNSTETHIDSVELSDAPLSLAKSLPTAGISDLRIYRRWLVDDEVALLAKEFELKKLLASEVDWSQLTKEQESLATSFYHATANEAYSKPSRDLARTERRRDYIYSRSVTTLVTEERDTEPIAWVLERGEYDQRREQVGPGVPDALAFSWNAKQPNVEPRNRAEFAQWLVHPDHPLTARVMVNRLWQSVFGVGLVKTSEDFGVMGDRPTHPGLLDWLAVEFVESDWDMRHMMKLMFMSATYRQDSAATPQKLKADPTNRFLSRGSRYRIDAELLRDQILSVSGLLRPDMGGPAVKPYQPDGLWNVVAITGSNTRYFKKDSGDKLYRRSLYTFWKRTSPPPAMAAFDAPTREQCTVRRERTNTPLQALVLMNDTQYVEAARQLAQSTIRAEKEAKARAEWMFRKTLARPAEAEDIADMLSLREAVHAVFSKDQEAGKKLINTGDSKPDNKLNPVEVATWTLVANTLLNRDDFVNK